MLIPCSPRTKLPGVPWLLCATLELHRDAQRPVDDSFGNQTCDMLWKPFLFNRAESHGDISQGTLERIQNSLQQKEDNQTGRAQALRIILKL